MPLIRPATIHDAAAIAHVHVQSWRSTYAGIVPAPFLADLSEADRTGQWNEWLQLDLPVYVAESETQTNRGVVGFIGGAARDQLPGFDAELFAIYLLEPAQRQGTGTALLQALAQDLIQRGFTAMLAWVLERNASQCFYERTGAHPVQSKTIEVGGTHLPVQAYGWASLASLLDR